MSNIWGKQDELIIHLESEAAITPAAEVLDLEDNVIRSFVTIEQAKDYVLDRTEHEGHVHNWAK